MGEIVSPFLGIVSRLVISAFPTATVANSDWVLIEDVDDGNKLKKVTAQSVGNLGGGGGGGDGFPKALGYMGF